MAKIILITFLSIEVILSLVFKRIGKFKNMTSFFDLLFALGAINFFVILCFDNLIFSLEHEEWFYYMELGIGILVQLIFILIYFIVKRKNQVK